MVNIIGKWKQMVKVYVQRIEEWEIQGKKEILWIESELGMEEAWENAYVRGNVSRMGERE